MSMRVELRGYRDGDDMSDPDAGVVLGYGPYPIREKDRHAGVQQHSADMEHGFDVDVDKLDRSFARLRFIVSF